MNRTLFSVQMLPPRAMAGLSHFEAMSMDLHIALSEMLPVEHISKLLGLSKEMRAIWCSNTIWRGVCLRYTMKDRCTAFIKSVVDAPEKAGDCCFRLFYDDLQLRLPIPEVCLIRGECPDSLHMPYHDPTKIMTILFANSANFPPLVIDYTSSLTWYRGKIALVQRGFNSVDIVELFFDPALCVNQRIISARRYPFYRSAEVDDNRFINVCYLDGVLSVLARTPPKGPFDLGGESTKCYSLQRGRFIQARTFIRRSSCVTTCCVMHAPGGLDYVVTRADGLYSGFFLHPILKSGGPGAANEVFMAYCEAAYGLFSKCVMRDDDTMIVEEIKDVTMDGVRARLTRRKIFSGLVKWLMDASATSERLPFKIQEDFRPSRSLTSRVADVQMSINCY